MTSCRGWCPSSASWPRRPVPPPTSAGRRRKEMTVEPLTPLSVEQKLRQLVNDLARAQVVLREARDGEVDARHEYDRARRKVLLSEKSPKVTRGGFTVGEQSAWVEEQCADLKF